MIRSQINVIENRKIYIYRNNKTSSLKRATKITSLIQTKKKRQYTSEKKFG